jgi:hypothetical protein
VDGSPRPPPAGIGDPPKYILRGSFVLPEICSSAVADISFTTKYYDQYYHALSEYMLDSPLMEGFSQVCVPDVSV